MARLTKAELEAVIATAGNVDPCMFEEEGMGGGRRAEAKAERRLAAFDRGMEKLRLMLASRENRTVR